MTHQEWPITTLPTPVRSTLRHAWLIFGGVQLVQWLAWLGLLGLIVLLAAFSYAPGVRISATPIAMGLFLWMLVAFPLAGLIFVLGRLIGGNLVRFRFVELTVGPLKLQREAGRLHLKRNRSPVRYGSVTICAPDDTGDLRRRLTWVSIAGPLANLVAAAFALLVTPLLDPLLFGMGPLFAVINLWIGVQTMVPYPFGSGENDGTFLRMLWSVGPAKTRDWMSIVVMQMAQAWRPCELKPELLDRVLGVPDGTLGDVLAHAVAATVALDHGDLHAAAEHLRYGLSKGTYDPPLRRFLLLESAYLAARQEAPIAARHYLKLAEKELGGDMVQTQVAKDSTWMRAEASVLLAEGQLDEAAWTARNALEARKREDRLPGTAFEVELLQELLRLSETPQRRAA